MKIVIGILFLFLAGCELTGHSLFRKRLYNSEYTLRSVSRFIRRITFAEIACGIGFFLSGVVAGLVFVLAGGLLVWAILSLRKIARE